MKNFLAQFFRSATRQPLPFKPLATINVPSDATGPVAPQHRTPLPPRAGESNRSCCHTNQLSS